MQTILTPEQRLSAYEYAMKRVRRYTSHVICGSLYDWLELSGYPHERICDDIFPELSKRKPKDKFWREVWFLRNDEGNQQRIQLLTECIEEVKQLIKSKD